MKTGSGKAWEVVLSRAAHQAVTCHAELAYAPPHCSHMIPTVFEEGVPPRPVAWQEATYDISSYNIRTQY